MAKSAGSIWAAIGVACASIVCAASNAHAGTGTTFPPDETFDGVVTPELPHSWLSSVTSGGSDWATVPGQFYSAPNSAYGASLPQALDITLDSPDFTPASGTTLTFRHQFRLEYRYDGAVLEISLNGGAFNDIVAAGGTFIVGGYNHTIDSATSALASRFAWTGDSGGFILTAVRLPSAAIGQKTRLRFRTADDATNAPPHAGWWVDNVHLAFAELPTVDPRFMPSMVPQSTDSTLVVLLSNLSHTMATLTADFVVPLPAGLATTPSSVLTSCAGGAGASSTPTTLTLAAGANLPMNASCTLSILVHSDVPGGYPLTILPGSLQTSIGDNDVLTGADLAVLAPPTIAVEPGELTLDVLAGNTAFASLKIVNEGQYELVYWISEGEAPRHPLRGGESVTRSQPSAPKPVPSLMRHAGVEANTLLHAPMSTAANPSLQAPTGAQQISQMADNTPGDTGANCGDETTTRPTSWWRRFYFDEYAGIGAQIGITAVTISSGFDHGANGVPVVINLYSVPHATPVDTIPLASLLPLASTTATIDSGFVELSIPIFAAIVDTANNDLVVEYHVDDLFTGPFYPGANASTQTHPTFLSAPDCGVSDPTPVADINPGLANFHLTMIVDVGGEVPSMCSNLVDIPWLSVTPATGRLEGGTEANINISADASQLAAGTYSARVCVGSNDPANARETVPVTLNVISWTCTGNEDEVFCSGFEPEQATFSARAAFMNPVADGYFDNAFDELHTGRRMTRAIASSSRSGANR